MQCIVADCKFYAEIEDVYKSRGENDKFGFKELQKKVQEKFKNSLKDD
jgi:hypothetical protein